MCSSDLKTIKLLEGNIGVNLCDHGLGNGFLHMTLKAEAVKEKIDKLDFVKIKNLGSAEDLMKRMKKQVTPLQPLPPRTPRDLTVATDTCKFLH